MTGDENGVTLPRFARSIGVLDQSLASQFGTVPSPSTTSGLSVLQLRGGVLQPTLLVGAWPPPILSYLTLTSLLANHLDNPTTTGSTNERSDDRDNTTDTSDQQNEEDAGGSTELRVREMVRREDGTDGNQIGSPVAAIVETFTERVFERDRDRKHLHVRDSPAREPWKGPRRARETGNTQSPSLTEHRSAIQSDLESGAAVRELSDVEGVETSEDGRLEGGAIGSMVAPPSRSIGRQPTTRLVDPWIGGDESTDPRSTEKGSPDRSDGVGYSQPARLDQTGRIFATAQSDDERVAGDSGSSPRAKSATTPRERTTAAAITVRSDGTDTTTAQPSDPKAPRLTVRTSGVSEADGRRTGIRADHQDGHSDSTLSTAADPNAESATTGGSSTEAVPNGETGSKTGAFESGPSALDEALDVPRFAEMLYRELDRKMRIERERQGSR